MHEYRRRLAAGINRQQASGLAFSDQASESGGPTVLTAREQQDVTADGRAIDRCADEQILCVGTEAPEKIAEQQVAGD